MTIFLDNLEEGMGTDEFLENYPSVTRSQVETVLKWENRAIREAAGIRTASQMRILLDENFPVPLLTDFVGHECRHVIRTRTRAS